jgi:hypothetical protein
VEKNNFDKKSFWSKTLFCQKLLKVWQRKCVLMHFARLQSATVEQKNCQNIIVDMKSYEKYLLF